MKSVQLLKGVIEIDTFHGKRGKECVGGWKGNGKQENENPNSRRVERKEN